MADYIDRDAAIAWLLREKEKRAKLGMILAADEDEIVRWLKGFPAADVAPVRRGKWLFSLWHGRRICSNCSWETDELGYYSPYQFCPRCGAKMDEEGKE